VWVCNRFVGAEEAGDYAAVLQWSNLIRHAGTLLAGVIAPMVMIYYARSEMAQLIRLSKLSVRVFSLVMAIPVALLCVFSRPLLEIWLGESFGRLWPLMVVMVCHLAINVGVMPLFSIQIAVNRVRWPGIVTVVMGGVNLFLAIFFATSLGWGIYGPAIAAAIVLTLKNAVFTPIYGAVILNRPWYTFLWSYVSSLGFFAALVGLAYLVSRYVHPASWAQLLGTCAALAMVGLIIAWLILSEQDKQTIVGMIPARLRRLAEKAI